MAKCRICGERCGWISTFHIYQDASKILENNGQLNGTGIWKYHIANYKKPQFHYEYNALASGTYLAEKLYSRIVEEKIDEVCFNCYAWLARFAFCDVPEHIMNHLFLNAEASYYSALADFFNKCNNISDGVLRELANAYKVHWDNLVNSSTKEALISECENVISCMKNNMSEIVKDYNDSSLCGKCEEIFKNDTNLAILPIRKDEIEDIHSSLISSINKANSERERAQLAKTLQQVKVNIEVETINISNILYFEEKGELSHVSEVYGGGSMDVNYGGAIIGDLLFGSTGALIGSRVGTGTDPIMTSVKEIDNRYVSMMLKKDDGEIESKTFPYTYYDAFMKLIPEKEKGFIGMSSNTQVQEKNTNNFDEIKKFKELFDMGIITEKEFQEKKKELLGL